MTPGQRKSRLKAQANAKARYRLLTDALDEGKTIEEAASSVGLTTKGAQTAIYRNTGSSVYSRTDGE